MNRVKSAVDYAIANMAIIGKLIDPFVKEAAEIENDPAYKGANLGTAIVVAQYADQLTKELQSEIDALKAQNVALLAALENAEPFLSGCVRYVTKDAIAKARGNQV